MTATTQQDAETYGAAAADTDKKAWTLLATPAVILAASLGLIVYLNTVTIDTAMSASLNISFVTTKIVEHVSLTAVSTVIVLLVAVPLGIVLSRRKTKAMSPFVLAAANMGQGAPAIGVVALLAVWLGIGFWPAIIALSLYSILPALRNTLVGLEQVDPSLIDAGRGIGMSATKVLFRIELVLAVPVILAGVRTTLVLNVGVASLATFIGSGGLGELIVAGVNQYQFPVLVTGSILIALLALTIDWIAAVAERALHPKGV